MQKVIFLDRDGTINETTEEWWKQENWKFTPGAKAALKELQAAGYVLAVVTNQGAIALGKYTLQEVEDLHKYMQQSLEKEGVFLRAVVFCPHVAEMRCDCRKPGTAMAAQVEKIVGAIDYAKSWMIGDKLADMQFGKKLGTKTILIRSSYWTEADLGEEGPEFVVDSLAEASEKIL
jgi:D-glycero-D-manno-heptose 1,7-bisphosphate phosphatase